MYIKTTGLGLLHDWAGVLAYYDEMKNLPSMSQQVLELANAVAHNRLHDGVLHEPDRSRYQLNYRAYETINNLVLRANHPSGEHKSTPRRILGEIAWIAESKHLVELVPVVKANHELVKLLEECWEIGRKAPYNGIESPMFRFQG